MSFVAHVPAAALTWYQSTSTTSKVEFPAKFGAVRRAFAGGFQQRGIAVFHIGG